VNEKKEKSMFILELEVQTCNFINIEYINGDATCPQSKGNKIIAHICNTIGGWGKGFVLAISKKWKEPESAYRKWHRERNKNDFTLGSIQLVQVEKYIYIANMISQKGIKKKRRSNAKDVEYEVEQKQSIRYKALHNCLQNLRLKAIELNAIVHMPRIGTGLAGGNWDSIEILLKNNLSNFGVKVIIYTN